MISPIHTKVAHRFILIRFLPLLLAACAGNNNSISQTTDNSIPASYIPDTGQSGSYTQTFGEDSDFNTHPQVLTDNLDGTITDKVTGLMWQKQDGGEMTIEKAVSYVKTINLGGFSDWRLPTTRELFSINNFDKVNPALPTGYFTTTAAEYWWTSEKRADDQGAAWVINAGGGSGPHPAAETVSAGGSKRFHTRAVRNTVSPKILATRFRDNGDSTITDYSSGLTWQKFESPKTLSWEEALQYANSLRLAGKKEWRVPDIKELQSLNDPTTTKPSIDRNFFPTLTNLDFWSSTTQVNSPARAWELNTEYGIVSYKDKTIASHLRCVRDTGN